MEIVSSLIRRSGSWFYSQLSEPIERFHLTINFMIDPPITGRSSPFGGLLPSYCLVVVGENGRL